MSDKILWRLVKQVYESENNGELVEEAIVEIERLRARVKVLERVRAATIERSVSGCRASIYELECALRDSEP